MAFRFPLETVLRLRQNLEHQQELLLLKANQEVLSLLRQVAEVDAGLAENGRRKSLQLQTGVSAAELQFDLLCDATLLQLRRKLEALLTKAQTARDAQAESFRRARQHREVIETLRRQQLQLYRQHEARQDQRRADDLFLLRRSYKQQS